MKHMLLKLWLTLWVSLAVTGLAALFGFVQMLYELDKSYISLVLPVAYLFVSLDLLMLARRVARKETIHEARLDPYVFAVEAFLYAGLLGNLFGLGLAVKDFKGMDLTNGAAVLQLIPNALQGVGTGVMVTFVGICCALGVKYQLTQIEMVMKLRQAGHEVV